MSVIAPYFEHFRERLQDRAYLRVKLPHHIGAGYIGTIAGIKIYSVNGEIVRGKRGKPVVDTDFTEGTNFAHVGWLPVNTIAIDKVLGAGDKNAAIFHEVFETKKMVKGMSYSRAHDLAVEAEQWFRSRFDLSKKVDIQLIKKALGEYERKAA